MSKWHGGKGSDQRPVQDRENFDNEYTRLFGESPLEKKMRLESEPKVGERRITDMIHPDSMGVRIWNCEEYVHVFNKYSPPEGTKCWKNINPSIEPFTSEQDAIDYLESLK